SHSASRIEDGQGVAPSRTDAACSQPRWSNHHRMTPQPDARWRRIEDLFYRASEMDPAQRAAFLERECGADADLRAEVESLLLSASKSIEMLVEPVRQAAQQMAAKTATTGQRIGPYEIIRQLGEGGMGSVYLAARADDQYRAKVAIKRM